jgi:hypothetical protein
LIVTFLLLDRFKELALTPKVRTLQTDQPVQQNTMPKGMSTTTAVTKLNNTATTTYNILFDCYDYKLYWRVIDQLSS